MRILILAAFLAVSVNFAYGQEVKITESEYHSALLNGYRVAERHIFRRTTIEDVYRDGKKIGYEKHVTENMPPDRSHYIFEAEYDGETEKRETIAIGNVSYCKENNGEWKEENCDRITGLGGSSVRSREWSKSEATFENKPVTQIRSYMTYAGSSKPEQLFFSESKTMLDGDGKTVYAEYATGVVGSKEILRRSITNYEYGLDDLKIEAPIP